MQATPGPWECVHEDDEMCSNVLRIKSGDRVVACAGCNDYKCPEPSDADTILIAHAPQWLATLVAEVEWLRERLKATLPEQEHWLLYNREAQASLTRGLKQLENSNRIDLEPFNEEDL